MAPGYLSLVNAQQRFAIAHIRMRDVYEESEVCTMRYDIVVGQTHKIIYAHYFNAEIIRILLAAAACTFQTPSIALRCKNFSFAR
ncbi:hypothetical protein BD626DRAFT_631914 [Schizophyllum amplum]|uniref:Uncharacterized protein n=1 Tax=Schizophyllum amplum TaxID=97359 RepID=A0A550C9B4_9AGAR|nr:hypothetical protein BD626DRAFT_631914 [Auriculariopsis ampla]